MLPHYLWKVQWRQFFENLLRYDEVTASSMVAHCFWGHGVEPAADASYDDYNGYPN